MKNTTYSDNFIGFIPNDEQGSKFLRITRHMLRGTGLVVRPFGRNPNRKQFYKDVKTSRFFKHRYACNLPLKHASHFALYIYKGRGFTGDYPSKLSFAKTIISST